MKVQFQGEASKLNHIWSVCVGAGRANEGLRVDWQRHLRDAVHACGFKYLRFHGLLHDDMHVFKLVDGQAVYNFQYVDVLFDSMLENGIKPFVEFGFMPYDLASTDSTQFWWKGNISPPKQYEKWAELIQRCVTHWIERYGQEEVRTWFFEIWNEPNLRPFWDGTKTDYFKLYEISAHTIKAIDRHLRVGGPATSNFVPDSRFDGEKEDVNAHLTFQTDDLNTLSWKGVWIEDFLQFCEKEGLPVDFISTHPYPTDFALDGHGQTSGRSRCKDATLDDVLWLRKVVDASAYPNAEIHLTEWSSSPSSRDYSHDYLPAAAYVVRTNLAVSRYVDSLSYWVFTDVFEEVGAGPTAFHGGFGLINLQGIHKPTYHAYAFLNRLGEEELAREEGIIVTRTHDRKLSALLYHYPEDYRSTVPMSMYPDQAIAREAQQAGADKQFQLRMEGLPAHAEYTLRILDREHGVAIQAWNEMGMPNSPSKEQVRQLSSHADELRRMTFETDASGVLTIDVTLSAWAVAILEEAETVEG
ncbi:xylann 1,4-beta-xylosidase [Paenibacillus sp. HB172176]|uniref:GH39 family glycosyl hydrolase n=1 Tax=Paenibacillus sp. HB172176 TaxID=2493690 RepID=UPI00143C61D0|nr:xylann 1,4-beta-xylosidase [Paenibacillus sp. HB172176]